MGHKLRSYLLNLFWDSLYSLLFLESAGQIYRYKSRSRDPGKETEMAVVGRQVPCKENFTLKCY